MASGDHSVRWYHINVVSSAILLEKQLLVEKAETLPLLPDLSPFIFNPLPLKPNRLIFVEVTPSPNMYFSTTLLLTLAAAVIARPQDAAPAAAGSKKNVYLATCTSRGLLDCMSNARSIYRLHD